MPQYGPNSSIISGQRLICSRSETLISKGSDYIFSNFSALIRGFALAMASLPMDLKSKEHPCCSGYLWVPQNVIPHLHQNPVNPTFLRQTEHLLGCATCCTAAWGTKPTVSVSTAAATAELSGLTDADVGAEDDEEEEEEEGKANNESITGFAFESASLLRHKSR